eukprot:5642575-Pyramimonas_sp.AAC.1
MTVGLEGELHAPLGSPRPRRLPSRSLVTSRMRACSSSSASSSPAAPVERFRSAISLSWAP